MMKLSTAQQKILSLAVEDYYGLWEALASLRNLLSECSKEDVRATAEQAVKDLVMEGLICLYQGNDFSGEEKPLQLNAIESALSDNRNWEWNAPEASEHIRIAATEKGEKIYYSNSEI